jgi:glycosyltransferase involved in cell wall biosynthesis
MLPLDVTVVVPTFDRPDWLAVSVRSILVAAEFAAIQGIRARVLVVDDGSPDDETRQVAARMHVDYLRNPQNDGKANASQAMALGLAATETSTVAFFCDDDVMMPRSIWLHMQALEAGADVCASAYLLTDAELLPWRITPSAARLADLLAGHLPVNDGSFVRTEVARKATWDPARENTMMYSVWLELLYRGYRFARLTEPTFLYRRHAANISNALDTRDAELRAELLKDYRERVLTRDGHVPSPSFELKARRLLAAGYRATRLPRFRRFTWPHQ